MASHTDRNLAQVKRIRRRINARLMKAQKAGRLHEAVQELQAQGRRALQEAVAHGKAGRGRRKQA
jgi:hypothetical protein